MKHIKSCLSSLTDLVLLLLPVMLSISGCRAITFFATPTPVVSQPELESPIAPHATSSTDLQTTLTLPATLTPAPLFTVTPSATGTPTPARLILPGMAGFQPTPTYSLALRASATPGEPPACPVADTEWWLSSLLASSLAGYPPRYPPPDLSDLVVHFLNQRGNPEAFLSAAQAVDPELAFLQDLTNDGQPEIVLRTGMLSILGCDPGDSGQYTVLGQFVDDIDLVPPVIIAIQDLNRDGYPELLFTSRAFGGLSTSYLLQVRAWDGQAFNSVPILPATYPYRFLGELDFLDFRGTLWGITYHAGRIEVLDADQNGTLEFIIRSGLPGHPDLIASGPWRRAMDIFTWNGEAFVLLRSEIDPAVYRFQAAHDADQAALLGDFERALALYQDVIFSDRLAGWSPKLYDQQSDILEANYRGLPTPTPIPAPPEETSHLVAYAYFRSLVLHALQGEDQQAQLLYDSLILQFPAGQPGHTSAELAAAFWPVYLGTHDVGQACTQALRAVGEGVEDILYWLDGDFHGRQAPAYLPVDLCPYGQEGTRE